MPLATSGGAHCCAQHRDRFGRASPERGITAERTKVDAAQHRDHAREIGFEPRDRIVEVEIHHVEVECERARGHAEADPPGMPGRQPRDLLGDQRSRTQRQQHGAGRDPHAFGRVEEEASGLDRIREIAGEATVMLAHHHAVEASSFRGACLRTQLLHHVWCRQLVVWVEPERHRPRRERFGHAFESSWSR